MGGHLLLKSNEMLYQLLALQLDPNRRDYRLILQSSENNSAGDSSYELFRGCG